MGKPPYLPQREMPRTSAGLSVLPIDPLSPRPAALNARRQTRPHRWFFDLTLIQINA